MKRVYYLGIERIDKVEVVKGAAFIHDAILGIEGTQRKLIQDTTQAEHDGLISVATSWREATQEEIAQLAMLPPPLTDWKALYQAALTLVAKLRVHAQFHGWE